MSQLLQAIQKVYYKITPQSYNWMNIFWMRIEYIKDGFIMEATMG